MNDITNEATPVATSATPGKKPLDPHLFFGDMGTVDDVRVRSGYLLWNLIDAWIATGYDDAALLRDYQLASVEWAAAKQYYLERKPIIDARIIANTQPAADATLPPMHTVDDYFAWLARNSKGQAADQDPAEPQPHG